MKALKLLPVTALLFFTCTLYAQSDSTDFASGTISIGVVVSKMKKSLEFYTEALGMKQTGGFSIDREFGRKSGLTGGKPFEVVILKTADQPNATEWKLMSFKEKATHPDQKHIQDDTGIQYVTMFVKSLDPFLVRLKKKRVKLLGKTPVQLPDGNHFVLVKDPDGTFIELIGPMTVKE